MMLKIFSQFICHLCIFFGGMSIFSPFLMNCLFSYYSVIGILYTFHIQFHNRQRNCHSWMTPLKEEILLFIKFTLSNKWFANISSQTVACLSFLLTFFPKKSFFNFNKVKFNTFSFTDHAFGVVSGKSLHNPNYNYFPLCFLLKVFSFQVLLLVVWSIWKPFFYMVWHMDQSSTLHMNI